MDGIDGLDVWTNGFDGWMNRLMNGYMDGWVGGMDGCMGGWKYGMNGLDECIHR